MNNRLGKNIFDFRRNKIEEIIFPLFLGKPGLTGHWVLIYMNMSEKLVYITNSLGGYNEKKMIVSIFEFLGWKFFDEENLRGFTVKIMKYNEQLNNIDRGVFSLFSLKLIEKQDIEKRVDDEMIEEFRFEIFKKLSKYYFERV